MVNRIYSGGALLLTSLLLTTCCGCYTGIMAVGAYDEAKKEIRETHADITVRGKVVDEEGHRLTWPDDPKYPLTGTVVMIGWRDTVRFQMESERAGRGTEIVTDAREAGPDFLIGLSNVQKAMIVVVMDGYDPGTLDVVVPRAVESKAAPLAIQNAVVVMRRRAVATATQPSR